MSDIFAIYTNSYLQSRCSSVNPRIINRCVNLARTKPDIVDIASYEPPWYRLSSHQPRIPVENVDVTRRPVAFGRLALPKLRRELHDKDDLVVIAALHSLCDLAHDPERALEAISLRIPDRLVDKLVDDIPPVREGATLLLCILAEYADGREAILKNEDLVENLGFGLFDQYIPVRVKSAMCFEALARSWTTADPLVEKGLIKVILNILDKEEMPEIIELHLDTLKSLMYECGKCIALKNNAFRVLTKYLENQPSVITCKALDCFALLTSTKKGKKLAMQKNLLKTLNKLLHYGDINVCKSAVSVIMFCTIKTRAKFLAADIKPLLKRLVTLVKNPMNMVLQMYSLKCLTNITEHPLIRETIREKYLKELQEMQVDKTNVEYKNILLKTISWLPEKME